MGVSEKKMKIVIDNYFKQECDVNTSIREAFEKGFRIGIEKGRIQAKASRWERSQISTNGQTLNLADEQRGSEDGFDALCYSLCVIAHDADERAERMYRKWKELLEYDMQTNGEPIDSGYNIGIDHAVCVLGAMKGADDE